MVTARFLVGTSSDAAILRVHEKIRANLDRIPVGIPEPLIVGRGIDDVAIVVLTLSPKPEAADRWDANDLTRVARELRTELAKLDDVGLTYIVGEQPERDPRRARSRDARALRRHAAAARRQGRRAPTAPSTRRTGARRTASRSRSSPARRCRRCREIGNLLLTTRDGRPVYVRDVADVVARDRAERDAGSTDRRARRRQASSAMPAVSLAIAKRAGRQRRRHRRAHRRAARAAARAASSRPTSTSRSPATTARRPTRRPTSFSSISASRPSRSSLLVAVAIGWREAIVVAIVIPTTILLTLFAARIMGYTLNRVSLFALIFSIGILVDDAIVVIENIARHWAMSDGRSRRQAAIEAVAEVGNPTIVATLTVVAALLPMLFVSGHDGPLHEPDPGQCLGGDDLLLLRRRDPDALADAEDRRPRARSTARTTRQHGRTPRPRSIVASPRPILRRARRGPGSSCSAVGVATLASLGLFYTKARHGQAAALRQQVGAADRRRPAARAPRSRTPTACCRRSPTGRRRCRRSSRSRPMPAPPRRSTSTASCATTTSAHIAGARRRSGQPHAQGRAQPRQPRHRARHPPAPRAASTLPPGTAIKVVEPPPGPPVLATLLAEIYGPDPETRRAVAAKVREAFRQRALHRRCRRFLRRAGAAPARRASTRTISNSIGVEQRDVYDTHPPLYGGATVGYSHRGGGRQPIPIRIGARPRPAGRSTSAR